MRSYHLSFALCVVSLITAGASAFNGQHELAWAHLGGAAGWFCCGLAEVREHG